jgi:hypothetical protein
MPASCQSFEKWPWIGNHMLDTGDGHYTICRQARVEIKKEGAGEKALQAPRNENVQSNRGKLGTTDASK